MQIRFGTDGWRGIISREVTFDSVRRVAAGIARFLEQQGIAGRGVAVGFDRRLLSDRYAEEAAGVLTARGIPVLVAPRALPTPVVSWAVREGRHAGGIMITASHNPPEWNGVKFKESFGGSCRPETGREVERILRECVPPGAEIPCLTFEQAQTRGLWAPLDVWRSYRRGLEALVDFDAIARAGLTVALDPMHGCGTPVLRTLLEDAGVRVREIHADENPGFGGIAPEPVESSLGELMSLVGREGCALGIANDGDADRVAAVDERGRYFSSQRILAVLFRYLVEQKGYSGAVGKAVSGTAMLDLLARRYGVPVVQTPIGFKHIGAAMLEQDILIGGEESGSIGIAAHLPERDGILNGLLLTEIVARTGKGLRAYLQEIFDQVGYFTYGRVDLRAPGTAVEAAWERLQGRELPSRLGGEPIVEVLRLDGLKLVRGDGAWLLIRPSGTESLLRVYAEARSPGDLELLLREGRALAEL